MKYRLTFKDPDFHSEDQSGAEFTSAGLPVDLLGWLEHDEYVVLEWDSASDTIVVVRPHEPPWSEKDQDEAILDEALAINTPAHLRVLGVLTRSELIEVPGSNDKLWQVRLYSDDKHYCNCPSMKFERGLDDDKQCKHIRATKFTQGLKWSVVKGEGHDDENEIRFHEWGTSGSDGPLAADA